MRAISGLLIAVILWTAPAAATAQWRVERSLALPDVVRALAAADDALIAAGPTADGTAWYGLLDPRSLGLRSRHLPSCHRCALFGAATLADGAVVLVGTRQDAAAAPARGWVLVVDPHDGRPLRETTLAGRGPVTLRAVDVRAGRILVGGEAEPGMGAGAIGFAGLLRLPDLAVEAEWPFEHAAPQTVQAVRVLGPGDFLAGGWALDARTALPGGWLARFGFKGEPFWQRAFAAPEVVALLPAADAVRVVGHRATFTDGRLSFTPAVVTVDPAEGRVDDPSVLSANEGRMVAAALPSGNGLLVAAAAGERGAERAELLRIDGEGLAPVLALPPVAGRATLPGALVRTADGALVLGGWLRGEGAPHGWLARLAMDAGKGEATGSSLHLGLSCAAGTLRVVLENRGRKPAHVRPLRADTVRLLSADEAPAPGIVGAMPGRPPTPPEPLVELPPGDRLSVELPPPATGGTLRAVYSPDFAGHGIGRLLVSPPLDPEGAECRRGSDRGRG